MARRIWIAFARPAAESLTTLYWAGTDVCNNHAQVFSAADGVVAVSDTVVNSNVFKHDPGIGGLVLESDGDPVSNVQVEISSTKKLATVYTDQHGWYMWAYKDTGKAATFTVELPAYKL